MIILTSTQLKFLIFTIISNQDNLIGSVRNIHSSGRNHVLNLSDSEEEDDSQSTDLVAAFSNLYWENDESLPYVNTHVVGSSEFQQTDRYLKLALLYLYRKATDEVKNFNGKDLIKKIGVEKDGILVSKGRLLDSMNFLETSELDYVKLGNLGFKQHVPILDRFSPLSYYYQLHKSCTTV